MGRDFEQGRSDPLLTTSRDHLGDTDRRAADSLALVSRLQQALAQHDRGGIVAIVEQLVAQAPAMGEQWQALAYVAADNGELTLARRAIAHFLRWAKAAPAARYQQAGLLAHMGDWRGAWDVLSSLPKGSVDAMALAHSRGIAAMHLGQPGEAREQFEQALALNPLSGVTWQSMAQLVDAASEPDVAERMLALSARVADMQPTDAAAFHHALGKVMGELGEHERAFAAIDRATTMVRQTTPYDRVRDRALARSATAGFDASRIAALAARQTEPTARAIFVTGLPRSGTTLVQQVLAGHPEVTGGGEINRLALMAKEVHGNDHESLARHVSVHGPARLAHLWDHWLAERFPGAGRVVDKTTNSSRMLGLAAAVLPEAPIVWVTRDPLDRAWSCLRTYFRTSLPWSNALEDIAFHFRLEDELLSTWQEMLNDRLLVVRYEALVATPGPVAARIMAHCGLADDPGTVPSHLAQGPVETASAVQVRQPVRPMGVGVAGPYRRYMEPFERAYCG